MSKWMRRGARESVLPLDALALLYSFPHPPEDPSHVQVAPIPPAFPSGVEPRPHGETFLAQREVLEARVRSREFRNDPETCMCNHIDCICERELTAPPPEVQGFARKLALRPVCHACRSGRHAAEPPEGEAIPKKPRVAPMPWWMKGGKGT